MTLTLERAAAATNAQVKNGSAFPAELRVVTDTRSLQPGDIFLALRGEHFDGHAFVTDALSKGAAGIVVEHAQSLPEGVGALVVSDTKRAYMDLAHAARLQFTGDVVAITGSAGKTTTKHLLWQLLRARYGHDAVLASSANENNEIGVSKLLLAAQTRHRTLIVEMGARHAGEIAELVDVARPHVGVLTNIGEAHLETFGSADVLAQTKWGLFSRGAQAVLNARDAESVRRAPDLPAAPLWFAAGEPTQPGVWVRDARTLLLTYGPRELAFAVDVRLPGAHNRANLAAALAAALLLGAEPAQLIASIPTLTLPAGRYQTIAVANRPRLIYDAYNANLSGMIAALDAFADEVASRRIAVLASMAEMGDDAAAMHERVGAHAAATKIDLLLVGGEYAQSMARGATRAGLPAECVVPFADNAEAVQWLRDHADAQDAVLFKGSRKYTMEKIIQELIA